MDPIDGTREALLCLATYPIGPRIALIERIVRVAHYTARTRL